MYTGRSWTVWCSPVFSDCVPIYVIICLALVSNVESVLGGTNLRVCLVTLQGDGKFEITQSKYRLTEEQKQEDGQLLFDFCAQCLRTFVDSNIEGGVIRKDETLPLGFTVSTYYSLSDGNADCHAVLLSLLVCWLILDVCAILTPSQTRQD